MSVLIIAKPKNFDLDQIYKSGQCFRWEKLEEGYDSDYVIPLYDTVLRATDYEQTKMRIDDRAEGCSRFLWEHYFDLITNYLKIETEVYHTHDKYLIKCYEHSKGIRILRQDLWEVLITFIISQNNNIPRIKKSVKALCNGSYHFPAPEELLEMDLSDKGLGYRDKYIKDACKHFMNQNYVELLYKRDHEIVRDALKDIQGVGDKVADCVRLFGLHHLEAFPIDTHIKQVIDREYGGKIPEWVESEYAGVFQQYIFYYETNCKKQ